MRMSAAVQACNEHTLWGAWNIAVAHSTISNLNKHLTFCAECRGAVYHYTATIHATTQQSIKRIVCAKN